VADEQRRDRRLFGRPGPPFRVLPRPRGVSGGEFRM